MIGDRVRNPPTVRDVAKAAGVSLATVDRVMNQRPGVRAPTIEKVLAACKRIDYRRDMFAANLAKQRRYQFLLILPRSNNEFMLALRSEAEKFIEHSDGSRIDLQIAYVNPLDSEALVQLLQSVKPQSCSGVAVVATDTTAVKLGINHLVAQGVPVVTLISDVPTSKRHHFSGIDNIAAGRTAASLLGRFVANQTSGKIALMAGSMLLRDHAERRFGFEQILRTEFEAFPILPLLECRDDDAISYSGLSQLLKMHQDIVGVYCLGAGAQGVVAALKEVPRKIYALAHDLNPQNRLELLSGRLDAVIHQDPGKEVRSAIRVLRCICDQTQILSGQEQIHIEIFLRDNLPG